MDEQSIEELSKKCFFKPLVVIEHEVKTLEKFGLGEEAIKKIILNPSLTVGDVVTIIEQSIK